MSKETGQLRISTDVAGVNHFPNYAKKINAEAGFQNFWMEGVGLPLMLSQLFIANLAGMKLPYELIGVHARTGQMNKDVWRSNSLIDVVKLGLVEPILPDATNDFDLWQIEALQKLGVRSGEKYWLIHDTEIDSHRTMRRYVDIFSRQEFRNVSLYIENSPLPGSPENTIKLVKQMRDSGLARVKVVGDTVHYWKSRGFRLDDIRGGGSVWDPMIKWLDQADVALVHFSDGKDMNDSHYMVKMAKEKKMLATLGGYLTGKPKVAFQRESQHGVFGPADRKKEVERLRWLGAVELEAGLFSENYFHVR